MNKTSPQQEQHQGIPTTNDIFMFLQYIDNSLYTKHAENVHNLRRNKKRNNK